MDYPQRRQIALAILTHGDRITRKAGSFLGQCVVDASPLTEKQEDWFLTLAERAGVEAEGVCND